MVGVGQVVRTLSPSCVLSYPLESVVQYTFHHRSVSQLRASRQVARMAGRVCVVIGVGPGLGMSCVRQWVKEGYKVCLNQFELVF